MRTALVCAIASCAVACGSKRTAPRPRLSCNSPTDWTQAGRSADHTGTTCAAGAAFVPATGAPFTNGQPFTVDPFLSDETADAVPVQHEAALLAHFQAPLTSGDDVFVEAKRGSYKVCSRNPAPCGFDAWDTQLWGEQHLRWSGGVLAEIELIASDWKPPPNRGSGARSLGGWEPLFHGALSGQTLWMPGANGTVWKVDTSTSPATPTRIDPFNGAAGATTYVTSPVTVAPNGDVLYTAMTLNASAPWDDDAQGFLVRVPATGAPQVARWTALVPGAQTTNCEMAYAVDPATAVLPLRNPDGSLQPAPTIPQCGSQRPALNAAPAVGADGTIFVVGRAHLAARYTYLVAVNPADLSPRWATSLRGILADGCGVTVPADDLPGHCYSGAPAGVDPLTGTLPAGIANDDGTSSPVALPDGSVVYGSYTAYNGSRGHLFKLSASGAPLRTYDFGWDITPAWFPHDGTYSIVIKDNVYGPANAFYLTQLDADLNVEWKHQSADGFEWCVNAVAVDRNGVVYANSEDGSLYAIDPGGGEKAHVFLGEALGAAYTPISLDAKGRIYSQNAGKLFVFTGP